MGKRLLVVGVLGIVLTLSLLGCKKDVSHVGTADVESIEVTNTETTLKPGEYVISARCLPSNSPQGFKATLNGAPRNVSLNNTGTIDAPVYTLVVGQNAINNSKIKVTVTSTYDPAIKGQREFTLSIPEVQYTMIKTEEDLRNIKNNMSGNYKLSNDIELTKPWEQLGDAEHQPDGAPIQAAKNPFKGILDGNGYLIKNIKMDDATDTGYDRGFFGRIDASGTVRNIGFEGGKMYFRGWSGVIAAQNFGIISNVYTNVELHVLGGCAGAIVVTNGGVIENSYALGKTTSESTDQNQAGFIGVADGTAKGCFADRETTELTFFAGGKWHYSNETWNLNYLRTTEQMQTPKTFTDANWDETYWTFAEGQYPQLKHR